MEFKTFFEGSLADIAKQCRTSGCTGRVEPENYHPIELEFMMALDAYKRKYQRPYPTCREVLAVLHHLGWRKS
jgi:hypothetical protein